MFHRFFRNRFRRKGGVAACLALGLGVTAVQTASAQCIEVSRELVDVSIGKVTVVEWYELDAVQFTPDYVNEIIRIRSEQSPVASTVLGPGTTRSCNPLPYRTRIAVLKHDIPEVVSVITNAAASLSVALLGAGCPKCGALVGMIVGVEQGLRGPGRTAGLEGTQSTFKNDLADNILYMGIPSHSDVTRILIPPPAPFTEPWVGTADGDGIEPWEDRRSPPREADWEMTAQVRRTDTPIAVYPWVSPRGCLTLCNRDSRCSAVTHYFAWFPNIDPAYSPQTCALFDDPVRFDASRSQRCLFHKTPERMAQSVMRGEPPTVTQYWVRRNDMTAAHRSGRDVAACPS